MKKLMTILGYSITGAFLGVMIAILISIIQPPEQSQMIIGLLPGLGLTGIIIGAIMGLRKFKII